MACDVLLHHLWHRRSNTFASSLISSSSCPSSVFVSCLVLEIEVAIVAVDDDLLHRHLKAIHQLHEHFQDWRNLRTFAARAEPQHVWRAYVVAPIPSTTTMPSY